MSAAVYPLTSTSNASVSHDVELTLYELGPATSLPIVDFSISLKSRLLNRRQLDVFDRVMRRYRRPLVWGYGLGVAIYPFMFALPFDVAQVVAACITVLCAVPTISLFSTLRYNMVKLMLATFDFWFCTIAVWSTAVVLSAIVAEGPARAVAIPVAFAGVQANVMIDANLRSAHNWVWVNSIGLTAYVFITGWCCFRFIPRQRTFAVLRFGDIEVPAESFVGSGLMTVCALLARNILRKHRAKRQNVTPSEEQVGRQQAFRVVECASYRAMLRYLPFGTQSREHAAVVDAVLPFHTTREMEGHRTTVRHPYMQQLRHPKIFDSIDPKHVISEKLLGSCIRPSEHEQAPQSCSWTTLFNLFGVGVSATAFSCGIPGIEKKIEAALGLEQTSSGIRSILLVSTLAYCAPYFALYQRLVFKRILTSFNFLFLDVQITIAHVCVCDFFRWSSCSVTLVLTSWIWSHWVLWLDALSPLVRARLGFHIRYAALVFTLCFGAAIGIVYGLVRLELSSPTIDPPVFFDRVMWSGTVLGQTASFRVVPVFYNCLVNAFPLALRLLWRLYTVSNDVLVVLDGAVVYDNYMSKLNGRNSSRERSRRWGSVRAE